MAKVGVKVLVDDQHKGRLEEVEERLKAAGMDVERRLDALGVITGTLEESKQAELQKIPGVAHVSPEGTYQIAPPDSKIQ